MYKKIVLKNGLRILLAPLPETKAVTLLVLFKVGSRYEVPEINGISHFIEHMMFKGTKKRPDTLAISKELDGVGAEYNAFTGKDLTGYYIKINKDKINLAIDILSDMLTNSKFDEKEIEREKGVIIEEIKMYLDNPMMHVNDLIEESIFSGSSLAWKIAGSEKVIKKINREKMMKYKDKYYSPKNIVIAVAGNFSSAELLKSIKNGFDYKNKAQKKSIFKKYSNKQTSTRVIIQNKNTEQTQLAMAWPAFGHDNPKRYATDILAIIMGGNMSSRLFINIRERRGLCYFIKCLISNYEDAGSLIIRAGLDKKRIKEAIVAISEEIAVLKKNGVTAEEVKKAKDFIKGSMILSLEESNEVARWYGEQELLMRETLSLEQRLKKYMAVTKSEVNKVAKEIMNRHITNLALIGPYKNKKEFIKLLKF